MNNAIDRDTAAILNTIDIIETVHITITPFPGLRGTYVVRKGERTVGWVQQVAPAEQVNAWEAINLDGDVTSYFPTAADAASYISNEGAE